ncbi:hypothetical protein NIES4071_22430 [Calothrix sp. NIES-4071]|nr:hypothetical protein NIES4071_22430 [Calothrix sp. NIES-4071]BAZ56574.1 hypothetical protein NIES4105_22380 [Calothrix sp. NIES-4105]
MYLSGLPSQSFDLPLSQEELKFLFTLNPVQDVVKMRTSIQDTGIDSKIEVVTAFYLCYICDLFGHNKFT